MRKLTFSALLLACAAGAFAFSPAQAQPSAPMTPAPTRPPAPNPPPAPPSQQAAPYRPAPAGQPGWIAHMCGRNGMGMGMHGHMRPPWSGYMAERLRLTPAQMTALKDLQEARAKAHADARAAICAHRPDLSTFEKRLAFRQTMMQMRLDRMKALAPKLIAFYNSLDARQRVEFEAMLREHRGHRMEMRGRMMQMRGRMMQMREDMMGPDGGGYPGYGDE